MTQAGRGTSGGARRRVRHIQVVTSSARQFPADAGIVTLALVKDRLEPLSDDFYRYYEAGREIGRLDAQASALEFARTQEILTRVLPAPPAVVADVGAGPGQYAAWLTELGYAVHLVDAAARERPSTRGTGSSSPARRSATRGRSSSPTTASTRCSCSGRSTT